MLLPYFWSPLPTVQSEPNTVGMSFMTERTLKTGSYSEQTLGFKLTLSEAK